MDSPVGLAGRGLLQSSEEWDVRNRTLSETLHRLAERHLLNTSERGLDVGCQGGALTDYLNAHMAMEWEGIDPILTESTKSPEGATLHSAYADAIPYPDRHFGCILLANVFEHIPPDQRTASFKEMYRVREPGGIIVGQIPNPYFPIESHSRLPFMGWLPIRAQKLYWRLSPVPWEHDFFVVTMRQLRASADQLGYRTVYVSNFNYPAEVVPQALRTAWRLLERPMRRMPWAWQFVLQRSD